MIRWYGMQMMETDSGMGCSGGMVAYIGMGLGR